MYLDFYVAQPMLNVVKIIHEHVFYNKILNIALWNISADLTLFQLIRNYFEIAL